MSRPLPPFARRPRRGRSLALAVAVLLTAGLGQHARLWAFLLKGVRWPGNRDIVMHLQLGSTGSTLIDGSTSWGSSAEDALATWNGNLGGGVQFTVLPDSTIPRVQGDGKNSVFFSEDVFGDAFGSDTLAITLRRFSNGVILEADVVFNTAKPFNSYPGPLRQASTGGRLQDFHRVALHEFGHVLGLGHPDDDGQSVAAIMNSRISDTDALQADDIAGIRAIYGVAPAPTPTPAPDVRPVVSVVGAGPARGGFIVSRPADEAAAGLTISYHNGGSAIINQDYQAFPGRIVLAAGQTEAVIPVRLLPGTNRARKVKVFLEPSPAGAYELGKVQSKVFLSDLP